MPSTWTIKFIFLNGERLDLGEQRMISIVKEGEVNARNYVPVRGVLEAMGYSVEWDGERNAVIASSKESENADDNSIPS